MTLRRKISSATLVMALATFLSRIAGLVRDIVVARVFGAGFVSDAFFMAFTIPNLLRRFFGEGSLTAAFVPTFSEIYHAEGEERSRQFFRRCLTLLLMTMILVVILGILFSPWIVQVIAHGFAQVEGKVELTDMLTRVMFPYIGLVSLLALFTGILNVRGHFFIPSLSPLFLNLVMIFSALCLGSFFERPVFALAVGVVVGGVVQLLAQIPLLLRFGFGLRIDFGFMRDAAVRKVASLMLPGIVGVAIYQINLVVTRLLASFLPQGSVSYLYYGQRLFEFPQGIFVVSLAQAVLPMMSRQIAEGDMKGMNESLRFALALISVFTLPAVVGLIVCAGPIYSLFFLGGEFDAVATRKTAEALVCYAPGLIFVGYSRIASQTFFALKDTRTPVLVSFWTLVVNVVAGYLLMLWLDHLGLALGLTIASLFNALALMLLLRSRVDAFIKQGIVLPLLKVVVPVMLMGGVAVLFLQVGDRITDGSRIVDGAILLATVGLSVCVYLVGCYCFRVNEVRQGLQLLRRRRKG